MKRFLWPLVAALFIGALASASGQTPPTKPNVLTHHNDMYRTGVYAGETLLTPASVNPKSFGKIFARRVLGQIWGQPLYVRGVPVKGRLRNVVYVATSENMVYGFDADDRTPDEQTPPLMVKFLGKPVPIDPGISFLTIFPSNGITSTPVIDPGQTTLYVVAKLNQDNKFHIFALDLRSLAIRPNSSGQLSGVIVSGKAPGQGGATVSFDSDKDHLNRPALLISGNRLIVAFGSGPKNDWDFAGYHGWVMSFSLPDLVQTGVFVTTPSPSTGMGAVWQSGNGPAADDQGNVYVMSGNGHFQSTEPLPDLTNSFIKLANQDGALQLVDWYAPPSRDVLEDCDLDLGSSGPAVIQEVGRVVGVGKSGILYVLNKEDMGKTEKALQNPEAWRGTADCVAGQCFRVAENQYQPPATAKLACKANFPDGDWNPVVDSYPHVHGSPVVWEMGSNNFNLYVWPEQDNLKAYHFDGQNFSPNPVASSKPVTAAIMSMPGGVLSLSWNGTDPNTGIIWTARPNPMPGGTAVGTPFVSTFDNQQHFVFRNREGTIWDSYYARSDNSWHLQPINTSGPPAVSDMFVSVFTSADQQHFVYLDGTGKILDSFYVRSANAWRFQEIDTQNHTPASAVVVSAFFDQQHFVWRDAPGKIWDSFFSQNDNKWHFQEIATHGHAAVGNIFVSVFDAASQQHFVYSDNAGNIWDSFYMRDNNTWRYQQIDTKGHIPAGGVFVSAFLDQQHFVWRDVAGNIWDSFYAQNGNTWRFQEIATNGHPSAGNLFVGVFDAAAQQHFVYTDTAGNIWDSFYVRSDNVWRFQEIDIHGHPPASGIYVSAFFDQQHFVWRDTTGKIWDSFYAQRGNHWQFQTVSDCMIPMSGGDLTPNDGPCNAINKIVRGYVQAFAALPRRNGQLVELWNSEENPNDSVQWFAKQSPPTIADGKVFVVEFPGRAPGKLWSANDAFGRLIAYSVR
jgi:hypothetical protein